MATWACCSQVAAQDVPTTPATPAPTAPAAGEKIYDWPKIADQFVAADAAGRRNLANANSNFGGVLLGRNSLAVPAVAKLFDEYITGFVLPKLFAEDAIQALPEARFKLVTAGRLPGCKDQAVRDHLVKTITGEMLKYANNADYHPATRFNAMMLLGQLIKTESVRVGDIRTPAIMPPENLAILMNELTKPNQIEAVRVAALLGILHHMDVDSQLPVDTRLSGPVRTKIIAMMVDLLQGKGPPERTADGRGWMARRAIDVLVKFDKPGPAVHAELEKILKDDKALTSLRLSAAEALGLMADYAPVSGRAVVGTVGRLGVQILAREQTLLQKRKEDLDAEAKRRAALTPMGTAGAPAPVHTPAAAGTAATAPVEPPDPAVEATRRRMAAALTNLKVALVGRTGTGGLLVRAKTPAEKAEIAALLKPIDTLLADTAAEVTLTLPVLTTKVNAGTKLLEATVNKIAPVVAAGAE